MCVFSKQIVGLDAKEKVHFTMHTRLTQHSPISAESEFQSMLWLIHFWKSTPQKQTFHSNDLCLWQCWLNTICKGEGWRLLCNGRVPSRNACCLCNANVFGIRNHCYWLLSVNSLEACHQHNHWRKRWGLLHNDIRSRSLFVFCSDWESKEGKNDKPLFEFSSFTWPSLTREGKWTRKKKTNFACLKQL